MAQETIGTKNGQNFFVGQPDTPVAATPAPAAPPVTRYTTPATTPTTAPLPSPTSYNGSPILDKPTLGTVDEAGIREETRKRMQSSIDAITANYANLISQEQVAGQDRSGQTRSMNSRSGLMGSDFGAAQQEKTTQFNSQQVKSLEDEKAAKVNAVLLNIEDRASAEIANKKQEALGKYQMDQSEYEKAQESARGDLQILAKSGVALESLNPAQRAALAKQAGYEDNDMFDLVYNAMKPKPQQIDYKFEKLADGQGLFYGVDPKTGQLVTKNVKVDLPPDWQMQIAPDGTVLGFNKNTGETKMLSGQGQFVDQTGQALKEAQIQKILSEIAGGQGNEPLSPSDAKTLGVPYGTTKGDAAKLGIIPSSPLSAEAQKLKANVTSGLNSLKTVKRELFGDENKDLNQSGDIHSNILLRSGIGMAREYTSATKELKDILARLRTGAAISETEEKFYQEQLPSLKDNEQTVRAKLKRFEDLFNNLGAQADSSGSSDNLFNQFEGGSEGTNPKAPLGLRSSTPLVSTKALASAVLPKYPDGSIGGQCVTFLHKLADFPPIGDGLKTKQAYVDKNGIPKSQVASNAKVGMILISNDNPTYGHAAMINAISADGKYARVTESNYKSSNTVSHDRVVALNDPKIYGAILPSNIKTSLA
jgi:hypothetical protein